MSPDKHGGIFLKNRYFVWTISLLALGALLFGYWSISTRAFSAENALEASYQRGFYNLLDQVNNINILMSKSMVTSSDEQRIMTLTTIWHEAEGARASLGELPLGERDMTSSQKFFAQLGDFSYTLSNKLVTSKPITDEDWDKLDTFRKNVMELNRELRKLQDDVAAGRIKWEQRSFGVGKMKKLSKGMADKFAAVDQKLKKEAPTITYDGPFSDHVEIITPKAITGKPLGSREIQNIATNYIKDFTKVKYNINIIGKTKGTIPAYSIEFTRPGKNNPEIVMDISRTGGHVLWFLNTRKTSEQKINIKEAVNKAKSFLESKGFKNLEPTGSLRDNNTLTVTFVPKQGEVLIYPDFIKVEVALDNGEIVGSDFMAYLINHTQRNLPEIKLTKDDVIKSLNKKLKLNKIRLALIPDPALKEILCYEADVNLKDERYFIYINAVNGLEEQILKVVETDKGTMTM